MNSFLRKNTEELNCSRWDIIYNNNNNHHELYTDKKVRHYYYHYHFNSSSLYKKHEREQYKTKIFYAFHCLFFSSIFCVYKMCTLFSQLSSTNAEFRPSGHMMFIIIMSTSFLWKSHQIIFFLLFILHDLHFIKEISWIYTTFDSRQPAYQLNNLMNQVEFLRS